MAALKAFIAAFAAAAVLWRLGTEVSLALFGAYALASSAISASPGLIWSMAYVGVGAYCSGIAGLLTAPLIRSSSVEAARSDYICPL